MYYLFNNITYLCVWGENNNILLLNWLDLGTNQSFLESKIIMVCLCYSMFFLNKYGPSNWYVLFMVRKDKDVQSVGYKEIYIKERIRVPVLGSNLFI